jgi:hypothetical protein
LATRRSLGVLDPFGVSRALRHSEEFAARLHLPLGTVRDWDQGRTSSPWRYIGDVRDLYVSYPTIPE